MLLTQVNGGVLFFVPDLERLRDKEVLDDFKENRPRDKIFGFEDFVHEFEARLVKHERWVGAIEEAWKERVGSISDLKKSRA